MSIRGLNLFNNPNAPNLMQNLGQNPFPLRGLERFMQKRGMSYNPGPSFQNPNPQGEAEGLPNTLDVQAQPEKSGGFKAFFSRFSRKGNK